MKKRAHLVSPCVSVLIALAGIYGSFRGFFWTAGTLFSLTKHNKLPDDVDSMVKTGLSSLVQLFELLFLGFVVILMFNVYLLFRIFRQRKNDHVA
jgi:hypothetical protein